MTKEIILFEIFVMEMLKNILAKQKPNPLQPPPKKKTPATHITAMNFFPCIWTLNKMHRKKLSCNSFCSLKAIICFENLKPRKFRISCFPL